MTKTKCITQNTAECKGIQAHCHLHMRMHTPVWYKVFVLDIPYIDM